LEIDMEQPTCPYCGGTIREGKRGVRLEQRKTCGSKACRQAHKNQWSTNWRAANPQYFRDWKAANPERKLELNRASRNRHRQTEYATNRARWAANKERYRAMVRDWEQRNPGAMSGYRAQRRGWKSGGKVSTHDWLRLVNRHDGRCFYCKKRAVLTMDHVIPLSRGGRHTIGNILPACRSCNSAKQDRFLTEWRFASALARTAARGRLSLAGI
jgi:5-methylcytosine-specific restriction endonuclease McrA